MFIANLILVDIEFPGYRKRRIVIFTSSKVTFKFVTRKTISLANCPHGVTALTESRPSDPFLIKGLVTPHNKATKIR